MPKILLLAAGLTAAITLASCSSTPSSVKGTVLLNGAATVWSTHQFQVVGGSTPKAGESCWSMDPYTDITSGAEVDITDASGKIVSVSHLGIGKVELGLTGANTIGCAFQFTVKPVPSGSDFYGVKAGSEPSAHVASGDLQKGPLVQLGSGITKVQ